MIKLAERNSSKDKKISQDKLFPQLNYTTLERKRKRRLG